MLAKRQQEILDFLSTFDQDNGFMPSTREIQQHFGFASHLRALERKGAIRLHPRKARAIAMLPFFN